MLFKSKFDMSRILNAFSKLATFFCKDLFALLGLLLDGLLCLISGMVFEYLLVLMVLVEIKTLGLVMVSGLF